MKVFIISCLFFLAFFCKSVDAQIYIVTEEWATGSNNIDSVFVTNPTGVTTRYSIPRQLKNVSEHDSQLSVIFNSVTSLGYKIMYQAPEMEGTTSNFGANCIIRTIYFAKPWTTTSSELAEANTSKLSIKGYPNPTESIINLEIIYTNGFKPNEIVVINEAGFIVYTTALGHIKSGDTVTLDLSNQKSGLYLITTKNSVNYSPMLKVIRK